MHLEPTGASGLYRTRSIENLSTYVVSTPAGRRLLNDPTLVGYEFQSVLQTAVSSGIKAVLDIDADLASAVSENSVNALYILRGGLNFGLHSVLETMLGRPCLVSFMSSQRTVSDGKSVVGSDAYRVFHVNDRGPLFIGDIAATGTTLINAIDRMIDAGQMLAARRHVVFLTIGTHAAAKAVGTAATRWRSKLGREAPHVSAIALEGLFGVYRSALGLALHLDQTDFVRHGGLLAPEYLAESLSNPAALLERCTIYDGGLRAFSPVQHISSVAAYWIDLCALFERDLTLIREHLDAKADASSFRLPYKEWEMRAVTLAEVDETLRRRVYEAGVSLINAGSEVVLDSLRSHRDRIVSTSRILEGQ